MPVPNGIVIDKAAFTPSIAFTATVCPMKSELQTYENNIGFLSVSSKGGGGLVKEMEKKIQSLKEEMELAIKKIDAIDENLE